MFRKFTFVRYAEFRGGPGAGFAVELQLFDRSADTRSGGEFQADGVAGRQSGLKQGEELADLLAGLDLDAVAERERGTLFRFDMGGAGGGDVLRSVGIPAGRVVGAEADRLPRPVVDEGMEVEFRVDQQVARVIGGKIEGENGAQGENEAFHEYLGFLFVYSLFSMI